MALKLWCKFNGDINDTVGTHTPVLYNAGNSRYVDGHWGDANGAFESTAIGSNGAWINIPAHSDFNVSEYSFGAWFKIIQAANGTNSWLMYMSKMPESTGVGGVLGRNQWPSPPQDAYTLESFGPNYTCPDTLIPDVHVWRQCVMVGSGTTRKLYVDGQLALTRDCGQAVPADCTLRINQCQQPGTSTAGRTIIDDFRFYNTAFTDDEVLAWYNEAEPAPPAAPPNKVMIRR